MAHVAAHVFASRHVNKKPKDTTSRSQKDLFLDSTTSVSVTPTSPNEARHIDVDKILARRDRQRAKAERVLRRLSLPEEGSLPGGDLHPDLRAREEVPFTIETGSDLPSTCSIWKTVFGVGEDNGRLPKSRLIHPHSPFHLIWTALTAGFLMYTATVVPAVIAFHWLDGECEVVPTLSFDLLLDTFFILDILYAFCVGVTYQGHYYDDVKWVARHYLLGGFLFDLATSIPVSYIELIAKAATQTLALVQASSSDEAQQVWGRADILRRFLHVGAKAATQTRRVAQYVGLHSPGCVRVLLRQGGVFNPR
jgi:hypothetical protein